MPAEGRSERSFDLSGIGLVVRGMTPELAHGLGEHWRAFRDARAAPAFLAIDVRGEAGPRGAGEPLAALPAADASDPGFVMPEGRIDLLPDRAEVRLAAGPEPVRRQALINLVLAALAVRLPERGALLLHAAGILRDGRAFLLVGAAGSGKSTWTALAAAGGAGVLSEDLVCVDTSAPHPQALSLPFRADPAAPLGPGRWPLAALLFPAHGAAARLDPAPRTLARAQLLANLPHVAPAARLGAGVLGAIDRLLEVVASRRLTFAPEPTFLPLLDGLRGPADR